MEKARIANILIRAAGVAAIAGGGYVGIVEPHNKPIAQQCTKADAKVAEMQAQLLKTGTLVHRVSFFSNRIEVGDLNDPSLQVFRNLKTERGTICSQYNPDLHTAEANGGRALFIAGAFAAVVGLPYKFRRED